MDTCDWYFFREVILMFQIVHLVIIYIQKILGGYALLDVQIFNKDLFWFTDSLCIRVT